MKTSKKIFGYFFIPALALAVLSGCGSKAKSAGNDSPDSGDGTGDESTPAPKKSGAKGGPSGNPSSGTGGDTGGNVGSGTGGTMNDAGQTDSGTGIDAGARPAKDGGSPVPVEDDPAGIDTEYVDDRGIG